MRLLFGVLCVLALGIELTKARRTKPRPLDQEDMLLFWRRSNVPKCRPFTAFKIDCNQCVCAADGTSSCTRMDCGRTTEYANTHKSSTMRTLPEQVKDEDSEESGESN